MSDYKCRYEDCQRECNRIRYSLVNLQRANDRLVHDSARLCDERDKALGEVADLREALTAALNERDEALEMLAVARKEHKALVEAFGKLREKAKVAEFDDSRAVPLPEGWMSPIEQMAEQMERLQEDNARLIRVVCALAEGGGE